MICLRINKIPPLPKKKTYKLIWADDAELNSLDRAQWACAVAGGRSVHPVYSRDASFLGTPLCEQEQPLNNHHDSGQAANGDRKVSEGDIPGTSVVVCLYYLIIYVLVLSKLATDCSLPFS